LVNFRERVGVKTNSLFININMRKFKLNLNEQKRKYDTELDPNLVSTRVPTKNKKPIDTPTGSEKLTVGREALSQDPKAKDKTAAVLQSYPLPPEVLKHKDPQDVLDAAQKHVERNLEWGHERAMSLPELAGRSQQWYVGGHHIANKLGERFEHPTHVAAAVIASQSPQKDWYQNVSLGERIMKIHKHHQDTPWSEDMDKITTKVFNPDKKHQEILSNIKGKKLGELSDPIHKAAWIRTYDEAHHPRHHRSITPEGEFGEHVTGTKGKRANAAWGSFATIANGVRAIESNGDIKKISKALGGEHKVRSFYNNILQPNAPKIVNAHGEDTRDVTVDTHAVGSSFVRPALAGSAREVLHTLKGPPASAKMGTKGTYPLLASAFRGTADKVGIIPNALQSVVWDEKRASNPPKAKGGAAKKSAIEDVWKTVRAGGVGHEEALKQIGGIMGPTGKPTWEKTKGNPLITSTFESVNNKFKKMLSEQKSFKKRA
jgi:hypothetical protein